MFQNYICEEFQPHSRKLKKVTNYLVWRHVISKFILLLTVKGGGCLVTAWFSLGDLSPWGNVCHSLHSDIRQLSLLVFPLGGFGWDLCWQDLKIPFPLSHTGHHALHSLLVDLNTNLSHS